MPTKPKNTTRRAAASRVLSRPKTPPGTNASGIGHSPNPVHFMNGGITQPLGEGLYQPGGMPNNPNLGMSVGHSPNAVHHMQSPQLSLLNQIAQASDPNAAQVVREAQNAQGQLVGYDAAGNTVIDYGGDSSLGGMQQYLGYLNQPQVSQSPQPSVDPNALRQQFAQLFSARGRQLPVSLQDQQQQTQQQPAPVSPVDTQQVAPSIPAPDTAAPSPVPAQSDVQAPVSVAQPVQTNTQTLGNRSLPGFAAVTRKKMQFAPVASRMMSRIGSGYV